MPRIVPEPGVNLSGYYIPAGVSIFRVTYPSSTLMKQAAVSLSSWIMHQDEDYFPNAQKFEPRRWIDAKEVRHMEKAFIAFGKGSRACAGIKYVISLLILQSNS